MVIIVASHPCAVKTLRSNAKHLKHRSNIAALFYCIALLSLNHPNSNGLPAWLVINNQELKYGKNNSMHLL
jgi:hypothetical protein